MKYFLLILCFFIVSCGQEESQTQSSPENQLPVSEEKQKDTENPSESPETAEPSSVMEVATIVLIPRIRITCRQEGWLFFPDVPNYRDLTCDRGTPVCGRRANVDPSSEPKPYCVIGDPEEEGAQLTMIPPEVASPYCKDIPFKAGDGGEIECFEHRGDE